MAQTARYDRDNIKDLTPFSFTTTYIKEDHTGKKVEKQYSVGKDGQFVYSSKNVTHADHEIKNLNSTFMEVQRKYDKVVNEICKIYHSMKGHLTEFNNNLKNSGICDSVSYTHLRAHET